MNNLFSVKLCNTAGHFYESVFIFLSLKLTPKHTQPYYTTFR